MQNTNQTSTTQSVGLFQISETIYVEIKKGEYAKPFLVLQKKYWSKERSQYCTTSILITVYMWSNLKDSLANIEGLVACIKSGASKEMILNIGEKKLLTLIVYENEQGEILFEFKRKRSRPDQCGNTMNEVCMSTSDFEDLKKWMPVIDNCIQDNSDVPVVNAITDPSQYTPFKTTRKTGVPPKFRHLKLDASDKSTQTEPALDVPPTPVIELEDPFKYISPTLDLSNPLLSSSTESIYSGISDLDFDSYLPLTDKPDDFNFHIDLESCETRIDADRNVLEQTVYEPILP
ncbi:unnamed protein product [Owenia fusiformis]|uniref:Uncharacterized protein n=1 Tax=Owenia fusiformis TaxID=6347 RepID=A0A8J1XKC1_OWEFU|nr:unnamed protein product [Owenia fusiformis]